MHTWSDKAFKNTVLNRALPTLYMKVNLKFCLRPFKMIIVFEKHDQLWISDSSVPAMQKCRAFGSVRFVR